MCIMAGWVEEVSFHRAICNGLHPVAEVSPGDANVQTGKSDIGISALVSCMAPGQSAFMSQWPGLLLMNNYHSGINTYGYGKN